MNKRRTTMGVLASTVGLSLLGLALHLGGHGEPIIAGKVGSIAAGASAVGGGVLTFGVGRRLLQTKTEETPVEEQRAKHG